MTRADYLNLSVTVDVDAGTLAKNFTGLTSLDGLFTGFVKNPPNGTAAQSTNPLSSPIDLLSGGDGSGGSTGGKKDSGSSPPSPSPSTAPNLLQQLLGGQ
jgi:hypothetical protein